jgi:hypothetical protein
LVYDCVIKRVTIESLASYSKVQVLYIALKTCTFANVLLCDTHLIVRGTFFAATLGIRRHRHSVTYAWFR